MTDTWQVNVAIYGQHYCKITLPSNLTEEQASRRAGIITNALGEDEVSISLTHWGCSGRDVTITRPSSKAKL